MLFLTKSSSARRSLLALLLALCFLSCALGAKIIKKAEKPPANANSHNEDKAEMAAVEAAAAAPAENNSNKADKAEEDEDAETDAETDADEDEDEDDETEEQEEQEEEEEKEEVAASAADKDAAVAATTTEVKPTVDATDLSVWGMVRSLWSWLRSDLSESLFGDDDDDEKPAKVEGRTFGKIRRLQMALVPIIFKFGVLSAMVAFLVAIGMKSLFLLKVLVVMNALAILGKFLTLKTSLFGQYEHTAPSFSYPGWNPHSKESWGATGLSNSGGPGPHPPTKEIHLHIHGNAQTQAQLAGQSYNYESQGGWASRSDPYGAYSQQSEQYTAELPNITDPMSLLPTKYPARTLIL
ncbi:uncharacterized protein LOC6558918 [Drosophila grimshawi]|uniref:GH15779 n=1 Tax=Drosophila grimshawi TaxID=7222 RepID=B4IZ49_DROGR|nr:uncharacterized protein LOC6558918 [Drosophila grimshawi]EDV95571.1 GH15779 [Drosophila grimshawi]